MIHRGAVQPGDRGAVQYQPDPQYADYPKTVWLGDGVYYDDSDNEVFVGDGAFVGDGVLANRVWLAAGLQLPDDLETEYPTANVFYLTAGLPEMAGSWAAAPSGLDVVPIITDYLVDQRLRTPIFWR
jgi:hypothetical protein